jgi:hypothetical protein
MNWDQIRIANPQQWLLVEATRAHSEGTQRVVEDMDIVERFPDSAKALQRYSQLHRQAPDRELYVFHTSRERLDITERQWMGIRAAG